MFEKKDTYFPIKNDAACQLKWTWSTLILTEGTTSSCHRCLKVPLDENNFDNFHNLPLKIKEREIMLADKWPTKENGGSGHCNYCKKIEEQGGTSDRIHHLSIPNLTPKELEMNNLATSVTPKILEVFLNNTCNMSCVYCSSRNSSKISNEGRRFGPVKNKDGIIYQYTQEHKNIKKHRFFFEKTLEYIIKNGNELSRLHLLGGETFYQSELREILDVLNLLKNPNLELNIVSNLMVKQDQFEKYITEIKKLIKDRKIGRFDLTCSIDGFGPEAEYARYGLNSAHWKKLFEYAVNEKWIVLNTNQTITSLTLRTIPDLLYFINEKRKKRKINTHFGLVDGRPHLHPEIFGKEFWKKDIENILSMMTENNRDEIYAKKYMQGCFLGFKDKADMTLIMQLKHFLTEIDKRRKTNWKNVFPFLDI